MRNAVLIAGTAVGLVTAAAAVLPPLIDWSAYGGPLAARLSAATGRPVTIGGPLAVRLLPMPSLSVNDVSIGNPAGMAGRLAHADRLRLRLDMLALLGGHVRLSAVEMERPELVLARAEDGRPNWRFATDPTTEPSTPTEPAAPATTAATPAIASNAPAETTWPVERLEIHDGSVRFDNGADVSALELDVAVAGPDGPFRLEGDARLGDIPVSVSGALERLSADRPAAVNLRLSLPADAGALTVTGTVTRGTDCDSLGGRLTLRAPDAARALARLGLSGPLPPGPLEVDGDLALSPNEFQAGPLALTLGTDRGSAALAIAFDDQPQADFRLDLDSLDLDAWRPAAATATSAPTNTAPVTAAHTSPPSPAAPQDLRVTLPRSLFAAATVSVERLRWRGQEVRQTRLEAVLDGGEVLVRQGSAQLPGSSQLSLDGVFATPAGLPQFDGTLRLASADTAALLSWLGLSTAQGKPPRSATLTTPLVLAWPELKATDVALNGDGLAARASAALRLGAHPAVAAAIALPGLEASLRGGLAAGGRIDNADFTLNARQGLRPLRAFGVQLPPMLERLSPLNAKGRADGNVGALAVEFQAESGGATLNAKGNVDALAATPRGELTLTARAASLDQVFRLLGAGKGPAGAFAMEARLNGDSRAFDVSSLALRAGPATLGGQGRVELGGARPLVVADLTADTLALDALGVPDRAGHLLPGGPLVPPIVAPHPLAAQPVAARTGKPRNNGQVGFGGSPFSREPLDLAVLRTLDARLSLKANAVTSGPWRLEDAVLGATLADGTATVEKLSGRLLGGSLDASATLLAAAVPALSGRLAISGADLGAAGLRAAGMTVSRGRLDTELRFATAGRSPQDMAARLNGDGTLSVSNGVLDGFDLPAIDRQMGNLNNIGNVLAAVQAGITGGRTPFSRLAGTFQAKDGVVTTHDLRLDADGGGASADGRVDLGQWSTRSTITVHLARAPQVPVAIRLDGPLENPRKVVDLNALQQHMVVNGLGRALRTGENTGGDQPREKNTGKNILKNFLKGLSGQ